MEISGEAVWMRKTSYRVLVYQPLGGSLVNLARNNRRIDKIVPSHHRNLNRIVIYRSQSQSRQGEGKITPSTEGYPVRQAYSIQKPGEYRIKLDHCSAVTPIGQAHWTWPTNRKIYRTGSLTGIGIEFTSILNRIRPHLVKRVIMLRIRPSQRMVPTI